MIPEEHEETKEHLYFLKGCIVQPWIGYSRSQLTSILICFFDNHIKKFIQQEALQKILVFAGFGNSTYSSGLVAKGVTFTGA